ncbi:MAG: ParB/RepB/Spo0J family partition protein [Pseudomonadota bacterium]
MSRRPEKRGLGRGLSALLAETNEDPAATSPDDTGATTVPIESVHPNTDQPRRVFLDQDIAELAASIERNGIIQPLIVRKQDDGYQIVAGERRWRAAQRAQLHTIPVLVRSLTDQEVLELAIIENVQRVDLNPVEEAQGYRALIDRFGHTQDQVATALGKSRSHIANLLRLLSLPDGILMALQHGQLTAGHARALITSEDPSALARQVIAKGLSVRQTEALVKNQRQTKQKQDLKPQKDADTRAIEADLTAHLGCAVRIDAGSGNDGGHLRIRYKDLEDLDRLLAQLTGT